jgi:hypothetical protein
MAEIQRYGTRYSDDGRLRVIPDNSGEYVLWEDAQKRIAELEAALREIHGTIYHMVDAALKGGA